MTGHGKQAHRPAATARTTQASPPAATGVLVEELTQLAGKCGIDICAALEVMPSEVQRIHLLYLLEPGLPPAARMFTQRQDERLALHEDISRLRAVGYFIVIYQVGDRIVARIEAHDWQRGLLFRISWALVLEDRYPEVLWHLPESRLELLVQIAEGQRRPAGVDCDAQVLDALIATVNAVHV